MAVQDTAQAGPVLRERDEPLAVLAGAVGAVRAGSGRLVVVEGAAGTGKSSLLDAALPAVGADGVRILRARAGELERGFAFGTVRRLLEPLLRRAPPDERARLLTGAGPAERVLAAGGEIAPPAEAGFGTLHALYRLVVNLAEPRPVVLVVDDAHWADPSSLRALDHLAGWIEDEAVGLVVALRPGEPGAPADLLAALGARAVAHIRLGPLGPAAVGLVVRERLPGADDAAVAAAAEATGGNPLLLRELLRALPAAADGRVAGTIRALAAPAIGDGVLRRLERLGPAARPLAAAMAVGDDGARLAFVAALAGVAPAEAGRLAREMRRAEILAGEDPIAWVHPLVRRSLYDTLGVGERDALHLAAAERLAVGGDPERAAAHARAARPRGSARSARLLAGTAAAAAARGALDEAVGWYRRALAEEAAEPPPGELLRGLGVAQAGLRDPDAIDSLERAIELTADLAERTRTRALLGELLAQAGLWTRSTEVVAAGRAEVARGDPATADELEADLFAVAAATAAHDPALVAEFDESRPRLEALARTGRGWSARALAALLAAVAAHRGEGAARVTGLLDLSLRDGGILAERAGGWATIQAILAAHEIGDDARALALCDEAAELGRQEGSVLAAISARGGRAVVSSARGELARAEAEIRAGLSLSRVAELPMVTATALFYLGSALTERSSLADLVAVARATELDPVFAATWTGAMVLITRAGVRLAAHERAAAAEDLRAALAIRRPLGWGPALHPTGAMLALALGPEDREEALALAAEELALARRGGVARPIGVTLRAAGMLAGDASGLEDLEASVEVLTGAESALELARSLAELGGALRRQGHRNAARERLAEALELADRCGAERLRARVHDELLAAGGRPRRAARRGAASLTASERRVAELAAAGVPNREIAGELFLSLKTVESHLYAAYRKLGLSGPGSRGRLAAALAADG